MKRIYLWEPGSPVLHVPTVRAAAVALARYAVNDAKGRGRDDPVHAWITEGRRTANERRRAKGSPEVPYSSCGDLAHWLLMCLGCRDERIVNRTDDGGVRDWAMCVNLSRLIQSPWYTTHGEPEPGDILHVASPHHVAVLLETRPGQWITADYGQPYGQRRVCPVRDTYRGKLVRGRVLEGWVSLAALVDQGGLTESALVPGSFAGGVEDDNPYPEDLRVPVAA